MLMLNRMLDEYAAIAPRHEVKEFEAQLEKELIKTLGQRRLMRSVLKRRLLDALNAEKAYWTERMA